MHLGHIEVMQSAYKYVDLLILGPSEKNRTKPNLTDIGIRLKIIKMIIKDEKFPILIISGTIYETISKLGSYKISVFIGSDALWLPEKHNLKLYIDKWYVSIRGPFDKPSNSNFIYQEELLYQDRASSTFVKAELKNLFTHTTDILVKPNVLHYIIVRGLYGVSLINEVGKVIESKYGYVPVITDKSGKSGNVTLEIKKGDIIMCYVKVYLNDIYNGAREFIIEVNSIKFY